MLPSLSTVRPCGPDCGVLSGYSLICAGLADRRGRARWRTCPCTRSSRPAWPADRAAATRASADPLLECDLRAAGEQHGLRFGLLREVLREVVDDDIALFFRQRDHRADELLPALARVATGIDDVSELMAGRAVRLDLRLSGAVGQRDATPASPPLRRTRAEEGVERVWSAASRKLEHDRESQGEERVCKALHGAGV